MTGTFRVFLAAGLALYAAATGRAAILVTEVDPTGSSTPTYGADWIELTNTGPTAVDITGWKLDDNSHALENAVALRGLTSIAAGQSAVFLEGDATGTTDGTIGAAFISAWFGGTAPAGFAMGFYGGSKVGLSSDGDGVSIFDATSAEVVHVDFGTATSNVTFDNAAGLNNATLTTLSVAGVNGAFANGNGEIGSPGAVPEPASLGLLGVAGVALLMRRRR
jgi:hypothetical protein